MASVERSLTRQQQDYVRHRALGKTPVQSAEASGYKARSAYSLEKKPHVRAAIDKAIGDTVDIDWIVSRLAQAAITPPSRRSMQALRMLYVVIRQRDSTKPKAVESSPIIRLSPAQLNERIAQLSARLSYPDPDAELDGFGESAQLPRQNGGPALLMNPCAIGVRRPVGTANSSAVPAQPKEDPVASAQQKKESATSPASQRTDINSEAALPSDKPMLGATKQAECSKHGSYTSTYKRQSWDGLQIWTWCPKCVAAADADLRWLSSLAPG
jgi:hypothetical protein